MSRESVELGELIFPAKVIRCGRDEYPVFLMTMHDGIVEQKTRFKKDLASKDQSNYKVVKPGQLVVGFPIDEGVLYIQQLGKKGIMSPAYNIWDVNQEKVYPEFLELALHSPQSMSWYKAKLRGTTARRRNIPARDLIKLRICLPKKSVQRRIVDTFQQINEELSFFVSLNEKLDDLVKSRFMEMFGDPESNSKNWQIKLLGEVCNTRLGKMLDKKKQSGTKLYPYLANANVQWFYFDLDNLNMMDFDESDRAEFKLQEGDVLATEGGDVGRCAVWHCEVEECFFQKAIHRIRCHRDVLIPDYFVWAFKMKADLGLFEPYTSQSTIAHLTGKKIKQVPIQIPPLALQHEFADFVRQVDKLKFDFDFLVSFSIPSICLFCLKLDP